MGLAVRDPEGALPELQSVLEVLNEKFIGFSYRTLCEVYQLSKNYRFLP